MNVLYLAQERGPAAGSLAAALLPQADETPLGGDPPVAEGRGRWGRRGHGEVLDVTSVMEDGRSLAEEW